jgi:hypothetical protein
VPGGGLLIIDPRLSPSSEVTSGTGFLVVGSSWSGYSVLYSVRWTVLLMPCRGRLGPVLGGFFTGSLVQLQHRDVPESQDRPRPCDNQEEGGCHANHVVYANVIEGC